MADTIAINSISNKKLKHLNELMRKSRTRHEEGCFVAEGWHLLEEAPRERLRAVYVSHSCFTQDSTPFDELPCPCYVVDDALFDRVSDTKNPQGVISLVEIVRPNQQALLKGKTPLLLVLDQISDPGNMGTIIRTAEAAGADAVILSPGCADPYQPKVVRSAMGALYRVPIIATGKAENLTARLVRLQTDGVCLYGTDPQDARSYDEPDYTAGTAFVIGNESRGVSKELLSRCDETVCIPMKGQVESLNAAIAASVLLFEAARQRRS